MCYVHPLPIDVILTSVIRCLSLTKINVSLKFYVKKKVKALVNLFVNFRTDWNCCSLNHMIKKIGLILLEMC